MRGRLSAGTCSHAKYRDGHGYEVVDRARVPACSTLPRAFLMKANTLGGLALTVEPTWKQRPMFAAWGGLWPPVYAGA